MGTRLHSAYSEDLNPGKKSVREIRECLTELGFTFLNIKIEQSAVDIFFGEEGVMAFGKLSHNGTIFDLLEAYAKIKDEIAVVSTKNGSDINAVTQIAALIDSGSISPEISAEDVMTVADESFKPFIEMAIKSKKPVEQGPIR